MEKKYLSIVQHYEECLTKFGDNHRGVDWPNEDDAIKRYKIMLDVIKESSSKITLLDFGCGASHLYEYIVGKGLNYIEYSGLDISNKFVTLSKSKYPENTYYCVDILEPKAELHHYDYIIMNGVFTEKRELPFNEMFNYFKSILKKIFPYCNSGVAFNVMSKNVDWEREDLFHLPLDPMTEFLCKELSRNFVIRSDYGLYEYTVYVYR